MASLSVLSAAALPCTPDSWGTRTHAAALPACALARSRGSRRNTLRPTVCAPQRASLESYRGCSSESACACGRGRRLLGWRGRARAQAGQSQRPRQGFWLPAGRWGAGGHVSAALLSCSTRLGLRQANTTAQGDYGVGTMVDARRPRIASGGLDLRTGRNLSILFRWNAADRVESAEGSKRRRQKSK